MSVVRSYLIYFGIFSVAIFLAFIYGKNAEKIEKVKLVRERVKYRILQFFLLAGIFIPLIFIYTFRYDVGVDYFSYLEEFKWYGPRSFFVLPKGYTEMGYGAINIIAYRLFGTYQGLLFLNSILTLTPVIAALILFDAKNFYLGLAVYLLTLFPSSFNGMRQHIAVAFVMLGLVMLYRKRLVHYVLCVGIACLFHKSSVFAFTFIFFMILGRKNRCVKFIGMVFAIVAGILLLEPLMKIFSEFPVIGFYYNKYIDTYGYYNLTHYIVHTVFRLPIVAVILLYHKSIIQKNDKNAMFLTLPFVDFVFIFMSKIIRWSIRMTYFTMAAAPFAMMLIVSSGKMNQRDRRIIILVMILTLILRFIVLFGFADYDGVIPYQFIFGING